MTTEKEQVQTQTQTEITNISDITRMDHYIMNAYQSDEKVRLTYDKLLYDWNKGGKIRELGIDHNPFWAGTNSKSNENAFLMLREYLFEPYLIASMNIFQMEEYFSALSKTFSMDISCEFRSPDKPVLVESIHHSCTFSALYLFAKFVSAELAKDRAIVMYQQENLDVRAQALGEVVGNFLGIECHFINITGNWYKEFMKKVNDDTIVVYMGDLAPGSFKDVLINTESKRELLIQGNRKQPFELEGLSISTKLVDKLGANHVVMDYPDNRTIAIRDFRDGEYLRCPLEQWIFWAGVDVFTEYKEAV